MSDLVSVEKALQKGHNWITYPILFIMSGTIALFFYLGTEETMPFWIVPVGFILSIILAWLYWSYTITKWRLWAFEHVRNVHELKQRAIKEKLIRGDGNFFEKTEIRTASDKVKLLSLQTKFAQKDLFKDDFSIPSETIIYYSRVKNLLELLVMIGCSGVGVYLLSVDNSYFIGSAFILAGAYFGFKEYKEATNKIPQIILNNNGIQTISIKFNKWSNVKNEEVISEYSGEHVKYYLVYNYPGGSEKLQIDDYATDQKHLEKLMRTYRGRSKRKMNIANQDFTIAKS